MRNLLCALCLRTRDVPEPAVTVICGHAVCDEHVDFIQDEEFSRLTRIVRANTLPGTERHS